MSKLSWWKTACAACVLGMVAAMAAPAQTFTSLFSFDNTDGYDPQAALLQATDGSLYGTTNYGGTIDNCCGTVFEITSNGTLTTLHSFDYTDGESPVAGLVQADDGSFYGTTPLGGANNCKGTAGCGTVFRITPTGTLTALYSFCSQIGCTDGYDPQAALVQRADGNFYGTTYGGGANGVGTVFKITPTGTLTTLHSFDLADGQGPLAALVQAGDGNFYGTTYSGGARDAGTVFRITPIGMLTTLYSFCSLNGCTDGVRPRGALVQGTDGSFYGTTYGGGTSSGGRGTVFRITLSGTLTTLYSFCSENGCTDGEYPVAGLVQGTDGDFYGTTDYGGVNINGGTVFKITSGGTLTTLYSFCSQTACTDGEYPVAALVQATDGNFYGTTDLGGAKGYGTVFGLSVGLRPFVETQPDASRVGATVKILGNNLTGAANVSFNGVAAMFTVVAPPLITATVPAGATTGPVDVTTPNGTLSSNVPFRVLQ